MKRKPKIHWPQSVCISEKEDGFNVNVIRAFTWGRLQVSFYAPFFDLDPENDRDKFEEELDSLIASHFRLTFRSLSLPFVLN